MTNIKCPYCDENRSVSKADKNKLNDTCSSERCRSKNRSKIASKISKNHPWKMPYIGLENKTTVSG